MKFYHIAFPLLGSATLEANRPCPWLKPRLEPNDRSGERVICFGKLKLYLCTWSAYLSEPRRL